MGTLEYEAIWNRKPWTQWRLFFIAGLIAVFGAALPASYARAQAAFGIGAAQNDEGRAIAVDSAGNTYLIGRFGLTVDFDPGPGVSNLTSASSFATFVASYSPSGTLRYAFVLDGGGMIPERGIAVDASGNAYITGWFGANGIDFDPGPGVETLSATNGRLFVASYDTSGEFRYAFNIKGDGAQNAAGTAIAVDGGGNSYVTGTFSGETDFDPEPLGAFLLESAGNSDGFVASYATDGSFRFAVRFGGTFQDRGLGIAIDGSGNSYVTGVFGGSADFSPSVTLVSNGNNDLFLASYTDAGGLRYAISAGGPQPDAGRGVAVDSAGNAFVTGDFRVSADFDPGPGTTTLTSTNNEDIFLASYTTTGTFRFAFSAGGANPNQGLAVAIDATGNAHITGNFRDAVDFDPGPGGEILALPGVHAFVASYTNTGAFRSAYGYDVQSPSNSNGNGIAIDPSGRANVTGNFSGTIDFDPTVSVALESSNGSTDIFFSSFAPAGPIPVPALGWVGVVTISALLSFAGWQRARE